MTRYEFGPFRLDPVERSLLRDGTEVRLTPKVFELLLVMVRRCGHLVTKDDLMGLIWPGRIVEEANLTQSVVMLRKALGDQAHAPRYIETRARRGYRFVGEVKELRGPGGARPVPHIVGRAHQLSELHAEFGTIADGQGRLVCVTGEPGIGKTALIEHFVGELLTDGRASTVARGRCSERLAGTGAYLPWLDALESLLDAAPEAPLAALMRRSAPTWYGQMTSASRELPAAPVVQARATSQELMKRELAAFLQEASRRQPLVIFLDDLHWADVSTVDLLGYLATRLETMRALFLTAYRASDVLLARHPFLQLKRELEARGSCRELTLPFLSRDEVDEYLRRTLPGHGFPAGFVDRLHARTDGNPLFMVDLVRYLRERGVVTRDAADAERWWSPSGANVGIEDELPASIRSLIERKVGQLGQADRLLLAVASVQGHMFDSLVVARALGRDPADVEERLDELARGHALVRLLGEESLADDTPTLRYRFVHVLYQNALYASLAPSRRVQLSGAVARALCDLRGTHGGEIASELAHLYEAARDHARATDAYGRAAERAAHLFAHAEAATLAGRGLRLLSRLPESPGRVRQELRLQVTLGVALSITSGYCAEDTGASITRAYALCRRIGDVPQLFPAIWRLWIYYAAGAESRSALTLARRLLRMARRSRDRLHLVAAHFALGNTLHLLGELVRGSDYLERAVTLHHPRHSHASAALYSCDPGLYCRSHSARTLWLLGYPERARCRSSETLALTRAVGDPRSTAHALMFAAICHQLRREPALAQQHAEACVATCETHAIADEPRRVGVVLGWARAIQGETDTGIAQIRDSLASLRSAHAVNTLPYYLALLADALRHGGFPEQGLPVIRDALGEVRRTGERFYEAELHRLQGELLLQAGGRDSIRGAEAAFQQAIAVARAQHARALALRASVGLARLWHAVGKGREGRRQLTRISGGFPEGFDTVDLREARELLESL